MTRFGVRGASLPARETEKAALHFPISSTTLSSQSRSEVLFPEATAQKSEGRLLGIPCRPAEPRKEVSGLRTLFDQMQHNPRRTWCPAPSPPSVGNLPQKGVSPGRTALKIFSQEFFFFKSQLKSQPGQQHVCVCTHICVDMFVVWKAKTLKTHVHLSAAACVNTKSITQAHKLSSGQNQRSHQGS